MKSIRHYENLHIPLWLIKDTCWMMEYKILGISMIFPTIIVAVILLIKSWQQEGNDFWINLAICFWIAANSYWMVTEFIGVDDDYKTFALIPFIAGMLCVLVFYLKTKLKNAGI
jgi:hypothetical protein